MENGLSRIRILKLGIISLIRPDNQSSFPIKAHIIIDPVHKDYDSISKAYEKEKMKEDMGLGTEGEEAQDL